MHGRVEKFVLNLSEERLEAHEGFVWLVGRFWIWMKQDFVVLARFIWLKT